MTDADMYVAFIGHPPNADYVGNFYGHIAGKVPLIRALKPKVQDWASRCFEGADIRDSIVRKVTEYVCFKGPISIDRCFIDYGDGVLEEGLYSIPYTTAQILNKANQKIVKRDALSMLEMVKKDGAVMAGLGAAMKSGKVFDSGGYFVRKIDNLPISNGNNYTIASCMDIAKAASEKTGLENPVVAIVGANGSIGRICSEMMGDYAQKLILLGNPNSGIKKIEEGTEIIKEGIRKKYGRCPEIIASVTLEEDLRKADLVISATDSPRPIIYPKMVKRGSVVVDIARPHDTPRNRLEEFVEAGCLVVDGGIVHHEGDIHFRSLKLDRNHLLACQSEPLILATAYARGELNNLTDWVETSIENVERVRGFAENNGFVVETDVFRYHYERLSKGVIDRIMLNAGRRL